MPIVRVQSVPHMQRSSPNASMTRSTGSQISSYGNGWCDLVQAPLTFTLTLSYRAKASSLGRSAQTSAGTGGRAGCSSPRWSITMTVSRCRWMCGSPLSRMPQHSIDRQTMFGGGSESAVQTGMVRVHRQSLAHSYANAARARCRRPFRHHIVNRWIGRVDRRHNPKLVRVGIVNFERVARIVFIGAERRDHDRTVDADTLHRSDHLFAGGGGEPMRGTGPRPAGMISIEGMDLNVDDWHGRPPLCSTNCPPS